MHKTDSCHVTYLLLAWLQNIGKRHVKENKRKSAGRADSLTPCNIVEHLVCSTEHNVFKALIAFVRSFKHTQM